METKRLRHSLWFFWSYWRKVCATSAAVAGEPLARRSAEEAGTGRGRLPPAKAALEVTPPQADETRNERRDTGNVYSSTPVAISIFDRSRLGTFPQLTLGLLSLPDPGPSEREATAARAADVASLCFIAWIGPSIGVGMG